MMNIESGTIFVIDNKNKYQEENEKRRVGDRGDKSTSRKGIAFDGIHRQILSEQEGRNLGGERNVEASTFLRRNGEANAGKQQENLVKWAKEKGCFYDKEKHEELIQLLPKNIRDLPEKHPAGTESKVYPNKDSQRVIKVTDYTIFSVNPLEFLDNRITRHNMIFPQTAYTLLGIMSYDNIFRFVTEQPFIEGKNPTRKEINKNLEEMGFKKGLLSSQYYMELRNGKYLKVTDARMKNFLKDENGEIFCIDPVIKETDYI